MSTSSAICPDDRQADQVAIYPFLLVFKIEEAMTVHRCVLGQSGYIHYPKDERVRKQVEVLAHDQTR
jgi:hypothetical protein